MMLAKQKETWDSLDSAKKKRRLQEFLKVLSFLSPPPSPTSLWHSRPFDAHCLLNRFFLSVVV